MPIAISLLGAGGIHNGPDYMAFQWCIGLFLIALFLSVQIAVKFDFIPASTFLYFLTNAIYVFAYQHNRYIVDPTLKPYLSGAALYASLCITFFTMLFMNIPEGFLDSIKKGMPWFGGINAGYVVLGFIKDLLHSGEMSIVRKINYIKDTQHIGPSFLQSAVTGWLHLFQMPLNLIDAPGRLPQGVGCSGLIDYAGMNGVLICLSLPFFNAKHKYGLLGLILCLFAIILSKSSVQYGIIAAIAFGYIIHTNRKVNKTLAVASIPFLVGLIIERNKLFDSAYRFDAYKIFMTSWWKNFPHWVGSGPGTFQVFAPLIQIKNNFMVDMRPGQNSFFWLWMHSDWLQVLFETGIIGLLLSLLLYSDVLYRLFKKKEPVLFSLACGIGASAIFDFPCRYFSMAFLTMYVIAAAYI